MGFTLTKSHAERLLNLYKRALDRDDLPYDATWVSAHDSTLRGVLQGEFGFNVTLGDAIRVREKFQQNLRRNGKDAPLKQFMDALLDQWSISLQREPAVKLLGITTSEARIAQQVYIEFRNETSWNYQTSLSRAIKTVRPDLILTIAEGSQVGSRCTIDTKAPKFLADIINDVLKGREDVEVVKKSFAELYEEIENNSDSDSMTETELNGALEVLGIRDEYDGDD